MCGIVGIINRKSKPSTQTLKLMADAIAHRGPDGDDYWISDNYNIGMGHRRLAIIDLTISGSQPMNSICGRYTIVYNGEIYNYIEIKNSLISKGFEFKTNTDTEVILNLFKYKGVKCLDDFDGMFSFAIWDDVEKTLFCARDRFGEKPFYYYSDNNFFIWGSEIKAIRISGVNIPINYEKVNAWLHSLPTKNVHEPLFSGVKSLKAGHYLIVKDLSVSTKKYWNINLQQSIKYNNEGDYIHHFLTLLIESISRRLRSDVQIGSCLSGGIDSSSIVSLLASSLGVQPKTFSAVFPGEKIDESCLINKTISRYKLLNYKTTPTIEELLMSFEKLIYHQEYPVGIGSNFIQWCVIKIASEHNVKVLLDGQGADEYLAGYEDLKYFAIWELYRNGKLKSYIKERHYFNKYYGKVESLGFLHLLDPLLLMLGKKRDIFTKGITLKERLKYALDFELEELLRNVDRSSMAFSIESRLPFLSHELVEFVFSIPNTFIYNHGYNKSILRSSMKNIVDDEIRCNTVKIGFAAPVEKWNTHKDLLEASKNNTKYITEKGLQPSHSKEKNYSVGTFIKVFS